MKWDIKIEQWMGGNPLYIRDLEAESREDASNKVHDWYKSIGGWAIELPLAIKPALEVKDEL